MVHTAFDLGITHLDLANNCGPPCGPCGKGGGSRKYMRASLDQNLRRVGVDNFDIFYPHRFDPDTPLEETMGALSTPVRPGKALTRHLVVLGRQVA